ncbi:unnamed protein product [Nezara viridula]|uniref:Uncharacterized protein n=1 Tax=Nezara viridula TaxID=85310 RepID=A0A9P0MX47_NEZVI|nr:unnamed protein product [Nezara viridula]
MSFLAPSKSSTTISQGWISSSGIQRSRSEVVISRGFKPSDTKNPSKTKFLTDLSQKIWGRSLEASGHRVNIEDGLHSKAIDLEKLFTPASDSGEITPSRSRKVYASSSFYSPHHPTMEEQVELARRISHSLSDISNRESKGQSMYVNRKKRSVKWVHAGEGLIPEPEIENINPSLKKESKPPLKLVMNPRGQVQDFSMLKKQGFVVDPLAPMSPDVCFDLVRDLNAPRGKGAELFAKRRKKSENWIIDENNVKTPEATMMQPPLSKLPPPSYLQGSAQRAENVQKMNQIQEKFSQPRLKLIKSPWEAALEGSVESAFQEVRQSPRGILMAPTPTTLKRLTTPPPPSPPIIKDELYKPKTPKAWNPQGPCKSFSSVKLEKIFAGSPRSPISLAYDPETNRICTEPVIVENIPPIATELSGYEVFDESILQAPKTRKPHEFLIYEPIVSKTMEASNTKKEDRAIVQSNNITSLQKEDSKILHDESKIVHDESKILHDESKMFDESKRKKASQTIEKKVTFRLNEEIETSSIDTNSEEIYEEQHSVPAQNLPYVGLPEQRRSSKSDEPESDDNLLSKSQEVHNIIKNHSFAEEIKPSETAGLPLVSSYISDSTSSTAVSSNTHFSQESQVSQKTDCFSHLQFEQESKSADEEVEDLCEREFNELSLEYEKVQKYEVKKPAAQVPGAVPIFAGVDFSGINKPEPAVHVEKKSFRKPGSLVPGAKPLFGSAIGDIHVSINESDGPDKPYEKIPVKSLINTFEQSTRPQMRYKQMQDKIPDAVSPNKFLYKEVHNEQKVEFEEKVKKEEVSFSSLTENLSYDSSSRTNLEFSRDTVKDKIDNMDEEEIQRIQQHYELQKHKKEIYDQQMQKYKEEMKKLRSTKVQVKESVEKSTNKFHEKETYVSKLPAYEQQNFNKGTYREDQNSLMPRSEESAPIVQTASYQPAAYSSTSQVTHLNYSGLNNFNTAPRGWQKSMSYYRPVKFNQTSPGVTDF